MCESPQNEETCKFLEALHPEARPKARTWVIMSIMRACAGRGAQQLEDTQHFNMALKSLKMPRVCRYEGKVIMHLYALAQSLYVLECIEALYYEVCWICVCQVLHGGFLKA